MLALTVVQSVSAQTYTTLYRFNSARIYSEVLVSGNCLYGTTWQGGNNGDGSIFRLNTDGSGFTNLYNFPYVNYPYSVDSPFAGLALSASTLYGTAGMSDATPYNDAIFAINTNGSNYTNLYFFPANYLYGSGTVVTVSSSLVLQGDTLYGQSVSSGKWDEGCVFSINTNGAFSDLHDFPPANTLPDYQGSVAVSGNALFGATSTGGGAGVGCVYSMSTNGSNFNVLYNFTNGVDGASPGGGVILSAGVLYGTTISGGSGGGGTVFSIKTNGAVFKIIHSFTNLDGEAPLCRLVLSDNTLYGTTDYGGISNAGTIFSVNTDGSGFTLLHSFTDDADGVNPAAGVTICGNILYGTTANNQSGHAVVYKLTLPLRLNINVAGTNVVLTWNTNVAGLNLQYTRGLSPPIWQAMTSVPVISNNLYTVVAPMCATQQYFRLQQ